MRRKCRSSGCFLPNYGSLTTTDTGKDPLAQMSTFSTLPKALSLELLSLTSPALRSLRGASADPPRLIRHWLLPCCHFALADFR